MWIPPNTVSDGYSVDWDTSPIGTDVILIISESIVRHPKSINPASRVCEHLMEERKRVKIRMKVWKNDKNVDNTNLLNVADQFQWALKIAAILPKVR